MNCRGETDTTGICGVGLQSTSLHLRLTLRIRFDPRHSFGTMAIWHAPIDLSARGLVDSCRGTVSVGGDLDGRRTALVYACEWIAARWPKVDDTAMAVPHKRNPVNTSSIWSTAGMPNRSPPRQNGCRSFRSCIRGSDSHIVVGGGGACGRRVRWRLEGRRLWCLCELARLASAVLRLKRIDSLPVSTMWQRCMSRSSNAVVIFALGASTICCAGVYRGFRSMRS